MSADRTLVKLLQVGPTEVEFRGRRLIYFGGSDYFRLSWNRQVRKAIAQATRQGGPNVSAGRSTTGNHPIYEELERALARTFRFPAAVLTATGYLAPMVAAQGLVGRSTHVLFAESAHGCMRDATLLLGVPVIEFSWHEPASWDRALSQLGKNARPVVFTGGLAPLEGSLAPLVEALEQLPAEGLMLVDDAHGIGTLGKRSGGALEVLGLRSERILLTGTLSKAIGCYGGFVLGPLWLRERILAQSRIFQGNTPPPPPWAAGALVSLKLLAQRGPDWRERLNERIRFVRGAFSATDPLRSKVPGPAFTLAPRETKDAARLERRLLAAGIYPARVRYAQGPAEQFYRFAVSTAHTWDQLTRLREVVVEFAPGEPGLK